MVVLLNIRVNCSLFASKPAHFSGHLPLGSPIMSFLLFALPCFSCKDAPLTGSCVPKPGVETRHPRFVRRDDTSPLRGVNASVILRPNNFDPPFAICLFLSNS